MGLMKVGPTAYFAGTYMRYEFWDTINFKLRIDKLNVLHLLRSYSTDTRKNRRLDNFIVIESSNGFGSIKGGILMTKWGQIEKMAC